MLTIAIVDDCKEDIDILKENLKKYFSGARMEYQIFEVTPKEDYIQKLKGCSLLFLDIDMPEINGIKLAENIRKHNLSIGIVFVTNFFQYAVDGYHVNAIDYLLKPIEYPDFSLKMKRIVEIVSSKEKRRQKDIHPLQGWIENDSSFGSCLCRSARPFLEIPSFE